MVERPTLIDTFQLTVDDVHGLRDSDDGPILLELRCRTAQYQGAGLRWHQATSSWAHPSRMIKLSPSFSSCSVPFFDFGLNVAGLYPVTSRPNGPCLL